MDTKILVLSALVILGGALIAGGGAQAQTTATANGTANVSAAQAIGSANTQALEQGLTALGNTLGVARARLASNAIQNPTGVRNTLTAIRSTLLGITGTVAALASRSATVAENNVGTGTSARTGGSVAQNTTNTTSPGLPNTGGGGARWLK